MDMNETDVNYNMNQASITCTMWHGPDAGHFDERDVSWIVGWQPVDYDQGDIQIEGKGGADKCFVELTSRNVDESFSRIYQCTLDGSPLEFTSDVMTVKSGEDVTVKCKLEMPKEEVERQKDNIIWFMADVITDTHRQEPKFTTSFQ